MHPIGFLLWLLHGSYFPKLTRKHNQVVTLILKQLCQHLNRQPIAACHKEVLTTLQNQSPKLQSCRCCTFCRLITAQLCFCTLYIISNIYSFLFLLFSSFPTFLVVLHNKPCASLVILSIVFPPAWWYYIDIRNRK